MTNEERDIISQFIARVGGVSAQPSFAGGSVPATQQPALPPIDREADQFIAQNLERYPEARYRITQLAFVQERALIEAQNRIKRLEWELQQSQQAAQQAAQQSAQRPAGGGFLSGLFGGGNRQQAGGPPPGGAWGGGPPPPPYQPSAPPPQPQYPPNYQQGALPRSGSGFLGSALTTAAGVAGGMVAGNALMSLFSPHQGLGGGFGGGMAEGSPWANPSVAGPDAVDTGGWNAGATPAGNQDYVDNGSWDQANSNDTSWTDNSGGGGGFDTGGGGWDSGGGGGSDDTF